MKQRFFLIFALAVGSLGVSCKHSNETAEFGLLGSQIRYTNSKQFFTAIKSMPLHTREKAILNQVIVGNFPAFLTKLKPVNVSVKTPSGNVEGTIFTMPDYFCIGSNDDYVRIPMTPVLAQKIASHLGFMLPTTKMVDDIYQSASIKLNPAPIPYAPDMVTPKKFWQHNKMISKQLKSHELGVLIAGHKKDIVITNRHLVQPRQVAIYGWHRKNGKPIQPLSLVHDNLYADYSHGVRLVSKEMLINGEMKPVSEILKDKSLSKIISNEGVMESPSIPIKTISDELSLRSRKTLKAIKIRDLHKIFPNAKWNYGTRKQRNS